MRKALAIIVCDRVEYFTKMAASLAKNNLSEYDLFFFIDAKGGPLVETYHQILRSFGIEKYNFSVAHRNLGCCINIVRSRRILFDDYGYDFVVYADDDVIMSKDFLDTHTNLITWALKTYDNVGTISLWNGWEMSREHKSTRLNLVYGNTNASMTCGMTKECWNDIRSEIADYVTTCEPWLAVDNHLACVRFLYNKFCTIKPTREFQRPASHYFEWDSTVETHKDDMVSGQDMMFPIAINKRGWLGLTTVVNRCSNIGINGVHTTPELWEEKYIYKDIVLDEFEGEKDIKEFQLILPD